MPLPPLLCLPVELHQNIISRLEFQDRTGISLTNRYFMSIIKPATHAELLNAEISGWAVSKRLFACRACLRLRFPSNFADDMKRSKRSRGDAEASARFCIDCGVAQHWYAEGTHLRVSGVLHVVRRKPPIFTDRTGVNGYECVAVSRPVCESANDGCFEQEHDWTYLTTTFAEGQHAPSLLIEELLEFHPPRHI